MYLAGFKGHCPEKPHGSKDYQKHIRHQQAIKPQFQRIWFVHSPRALKMAAAMVEHRRKRTGVMTTPYAEAGGFWTVMPDAPAPDVQWHFVPAVLEDHGREKVKAHGALSAVELTHNGYTASNLYSREVPISPMHTPLKYGYPLQARAMTLHDIREYRRWHKNAAIRAR